MEKKFLICEHCGNIVEMIKSVGVPIFCCGTIMPELTSNTKEAATEKHIPVVTIDKNIVNIAVGSVMHPSVTEHYIEWVSVETNKGIHKLEFKPEIEPVATVLLSDGEVATKVMAYCNLHGLWSVTI